MELYQPKAQINVEKKTNVTTTAQSKRIPHNPFQPFLPFDPRGFEPLTAGKPPPSSSPLPPVSPPLGGPCSGQDLKVSFRGHVSKSIDVLLKIHHVHFVHPKKNWGIIKYHPNAWGTSPVPSMAWWCFLPASPSPPSVDAAASSFTGTASSPASWDGPMSVGFNEKKMANKKWTASNTPCKCQAEKYPEPFEGFPISKGDESLIDYEGLNQPSWASSFGRKSTSAVTKNSALKVTGRKNSRVMKDHIFWPVSSIPC